MRRPSEPRPAPPRRADVTAITTPGSQVALVAGVATVCLLVAVTFQIFDTDLWMHLTRARAALSLHGLPHQQLWTWPMYGAPDPSSPAWGFAFLVWPFWAIGGVLGLFVWRWLVALAIFGVAWLTARRLGARGLAVVIVLLACAMIYRPRSQVRPETLAALLLALEIWILETRRQGGPDRAWWLVPIAWFWIGVHVSFWVCWLVCGCFVVDEWRRSNTAPRRGAPLVFVMLATIAACFLNPLAGRTLLVPLQFLSLRKEPLYQAIGELHSIDWSINWQNGLPLLMLGWALVQLWRWRRGRGDLAEALLFLLFTGWAFSAQRFLTFWAVVAAPYLARGVFEWQAARPRRESRAPALRTAGAIAACVAITALEVLRSGYPLGVAIHPNSVPAAACDFIAAHDVRGRSFNYFEHGGYLTWRFWPDRTRLPFLTTSPELATPQLRLEYQRALSGWADWRRMDGRHRFEWALVRRQTQAGDHLVDFLDADTSFALVFVDDVSALFARRSGPMAPVASQYGFHWLPAGQEKLNVVGARLSTDSTARAEMRAELERAIATSPRHSEMALTLASLDIAEHRWDDAQRELEDAHRIDPGLPGYAERRAMIAAGRGSMGP